MLPTSEGVEPSTYWSPVGRRIQMSHRDRYGSDKELFLEIQAIKSQITENFKFWCFFVAFVVADVFIIYNNKYSKLYRY